VEFTGKKEATILSMSLPVGSYIVSAKTVVSASAATTGFRAAVVCELLDGGPGAVLDTSGWDTGLVEDSGKFIGETTLALDAAVTLKAATIVSLACSDQSPEATEPKVGAASSQIVAVETTQNK
jgi:hypothetical protein